MSKHGIKSRRSPEKNLRTKNRNLLRHEWRQDNPAFRGRQLKCWPLPQVINGALVFVD